MRGIAFKGNSIAEVIDYPDIAPGPEQVLIKLRSSATFNLKAPIASFTTFVLSAPKKIIIGVSRAARFRVYRPL